MSEFVEGAMHTGWFCFLKQLWVFFGTVQRVELAHLIGIYQQSFLQGVGVNTAKWHLKFGSPHFFYSCHSGLYKDRLGSGL